MNETFDFFERLEYSENIQPGSAVMNAIMEMVPNAIAVERATTSEDKSGTDYWITRTHGLPALSVDIKNRDFCPIKKFNSDDACIETTSVYNGSGPPWEDWNRCKVGWSLDYSKRTDFVVYTWPNGRGVRYWIIPFVPLCAASRKHWRAWAVQYKERAAKNNGYVTLSVYPPRNVIAAAMYDFMRGTV